MSEYERQLVASAVADELERRKDAPPRQYRDSDLEHMTPEEIRQAQDEGRLDHLLNGRTSA